MNKFIERLNEFAQERKLTIERLANELNMSSSTFYTWINRSSMPKLNIMILLSNYFRCSIDYLVGRTDNLEDLPPQDCPPFHEKLETILKSRGLNKTHLRNKKIISRGLSESIFELHSSPFMDNVIKIADYLKISVDELVGRI